MKWFLFYVIWFALATWYFMANLGDKTSCKRDWKFWFEWIFIAPPLIPIIYLFSLIARILRN